MSVQTDFIAQIRDAALEVQRQYHVPASLVIAQALWESRSGQSGLSTKANNYFGMKVNSHWNGATIVLPTHEEENGVMKLTHATFRAYDSLRDSVMDYGRVLASRYAGVVTASNGYAAADAVQKGGYATDHSYAENLKAIIKKYNLTVLDDPNFKNYEEGARFDQTRQQLQQQREKNPQAWEKFIDFFGDLVSKVVGGIGALLNGIFGSSTPVNPQIAQNQNKPNDKPSGRTA